MVIDEFQQQKWRLSNSILYIWRVFNRNDSYQYHSVLTLNFWFLLGVLRFVKRRKQIGSEQFLSSFHSSPIPNPMSNFIRKTVLLGSCHARISPGTSNLGFVRNPDFLPLRWFSSSSNQPSFTVSYLIKELGFPPKAALSASKSVNIESPDKTEKSHKVV